jgi:flagellar basal body-associated protein FliL
MKHIVRAFVVVLVLTGVAATTQTSSATTKNKVTATRTSMLPVPVCAPDDPNACGMAQGR